MKYKIFSALFALILTASLFTGCENNENEFVTDLPIATQNPAITKPQGQYYTANGGELVAEGGLVTLGNDFMRVMIEGNEIEFALSENAKKELSIYNKDKKNLHIMRGTMLQITYTERDFIKTAQKIGILQAN